MMTNGDPKGHIFLSHPHTHNNFVKKKFRRSLPRICTSICLGLSINFSKNKAPLPNADKASDCARRKFSSIS